MIDILKQRIAAYQARMAETQRIGQQRADELQAELTRVVNDTNTEILTLRGRINEANELLATLETTETESE